jgi:hypothetical protein
VKRRLATVLAVVVGGFVAGVAGAGLAYPGLLGVWSARGDGGVPRSMSVPVPWQADTVANPNGPAALIATGIEWGRGTRAYGLAVVGRDGGYTLLHAARGYLIAGVGALLSPDGSRLARALPASDGGGLVVTDLSSGTERSYDVPASAVRAWRPDGAAVLVSYQDPPRAALVDLATGRTTPIQFGPAASGDSPIAAFSPDGHRVAIGSGGVLTMSDTTGRALWRRDLGPGRSLAGRGGFTPDGTRIALVAGAPGSLWTVSYVDASTGFDADGPAVPALTAFALTALGWHGDELVVAGYSPPPAGSTCCAPVDVYGLTPGSGPELLVDLPPDAIGVDIAPDLVEAGRFGSPAALPGVLPFTLSGLVAYPALAVVALSVLLVVGLSLRPLHDPYGRPAVVRWERSQPPT